MSDERETEIQEVVPIVEEMLTIGKRMVETGTVRVRTIVDEEQVTLNDQLARETIEVERVPMNLKVDIAPPDRDEGGTTVISIVEERLVLEKRLFVVEEVRIRRVVSTVPIELPATRRVMRAEIERDGVAQAGI